MADRSIGVWGSLRSHWKQTLVSLMVGAFLAGALFFVVPREWEAVAAIQVGQIGYLAQSGSGGQGVHLMPIESAQVAFERVTAPFFIEAVSRRVGMPSVVKQLLPKRFGGKGKLDVRQPLNSDVLVVRVRADSRELAQQLGEGIVGEITEEHARISDPIEQALRPLLPRFMSEIDKGDVSSDHIQLLTSRVEPFSRQTRGMGAVVTLAEPVFPRPMYFVGLGVLMGLVIAIGTVARRFL